jgi:putative transposase
MVPLIARTWSPKGQTPRLSVAGGWTKLSAISAISATPHQRRMQLYLQFHQNKNIRTEQVIQFLTHLLRHIPGHIVLLWDNIQTHKAKMLDQFWASHPRIHPHHFPGYAPELNPDEYVWSQMKRRIANCVPNGLDDLNEILVKEKRRLQRSQRLMRSCIHAAELNWR